MRATLFLTQMEHDHNHDIFIESRNFFLFRKIRNANGPKCEGDEKKKCKLFSLVWLKFELDCHWIYYADDEIWLTNWHVKRKPNREISALKWIELCCFELQDFRIETLFGQHLASRSQTSSNWLLSRNPTETNNGREKYMALLGHGAIPCIVFFFFHRQFGTLCSIFVCECILQSLNNSEECFR